MAGLFLDKLSNMVGENIGLDPKFMEHVSKKRISRKNILKTRMRMKITSL